MNPQLTPEAQKVVQTYTALLAKALTIKENLTARQFLVFLHCMRTGGLRAKELATLIGCNESLISRMMNDPDGLGAAGSNCLYRDEDGVIRPTDARLTFFNEIHFG